MSHLSNLKVLNIIAGVFFGLLAIVFGLLVVVVGLTQLANDGLLMVLGGLLFLGLLGGLAGLHLYTGFMVTAGRARHLQTTLAVLQLTNFPIGTLYAIYAFWVCYVNPPTTSMFDRPGGYRVR